MNSQRSPRSWMFYLLTAATLAISNTLLATDDSRLYLTVDGAPVAAYQASHAASPNPAAPWYGRSGFVHPVYTPSGRIVTNDFPAGHTHQHALMFAWTSAQIDGRPVDFWNSHQRQGHIEHLRTIHASDGLIVTVLQHVDDTRATPTPVLVETWQLAHVPHTTMHVFDLISTQVCIMQRPLVIEEYHYGAMGIRGAEAFENGAEMLTSEGHDRVSGNHTTAKWAALSGEVDGAICGIAALGHPQNFRAPQPVRLHPDAPYFCFAPMIQGRFEITPGEPYVSRFRFAAFDGPIDADALDQLWNNFAKQAE